MRDDSAPPVDDAGRVVRALETLETAAHAVEQLWSDPLLRRLVEIFHAMPAGDRETVVGAIEREVHARRLSRATEEFTGQEMHPNPHARLYVRAHEVPVPRNLLERDELMLAMLTALRVTPILVVPEIHREWLEGTAAAVEHIDAPTRAVVARLLREALEIVEAHPEKPPPGDSSGGDASS